MTAPAYLAVAGHAREAHGRVVAPSAAQTLAAGVLDTRPAACARRVAGRPAEAGGVLQVDQVSSAEALAVAAGPRELRLARGRVGDAQHAHRRVVSVLQQPAGVVEGRQLLPAGPYGARARDTVTLAGRLQPALHSLRWGGGREVSVSFCLIHYLASYLGGLSGQSETVSCREGRGCRGGGLQPVSL